MCCARDHYPAEVGLHQYEGNLDHYHIILPWDLNYAVCISPYQSLDRDWQVSVQWTDFSHPVSRQKEQVRMLLKTMTPRGPLPEVRRMGEIIALGVAEGGQVHRSYLDKLANQYYMQEGVKFSTFKVLGNTPEWQILPPEALEYHEWLVSQAVKEKDLRREFYRKEEP